VKIHGKTDKKKEEGKKNRLQVKGTFKGAEKRRGMRG